MAVTDDLHVGSVAAVQAVALAVLVALLTGLFDKFAVLRRNRWGIVDCAMLAAGIEFEMLDFGDLEMTYDFESLDFATFHRSSGLPPVRLETYAENDLAAVLRSHSAIAVLEIPPRRSADLDLPV